VILTRAEQVAAFLKQRRGLGIKDAKKRIPRGVRPRLIERSYGSALIAFMRKVEREFDPLMEALPGLLANAAREGRIDSVRLDAGEGKRVRELVAEARARMTNTISGQVDDLAAKFAQETSAHGRIQLNRQTRAALGADVFINDRGLATLMERFVDSNVGLIKKLSDEQAGHIESAILRAVQDAKPYTELAGELQDRFGIGERRAVLIARDQIGKFYGQTNAARHRELGISKFIWRTANDERVRDEHEALEGQVFSYDDPPSEGLPGEPIQCRCYADPDFSDILGLLDS